MRKLKHTLDKGACSEAKILAALVQCGWNIFVSWSQNTRFDFVGEKNSILYRIQCKTAHPLNGTLIFNTKSSNARIKGKSYFGEIDLFAVYSPVTDKVYIVPCTKITPRCLRIRPPKNFNRKNINWAVDFEIEKFK